MQPETRFQEVGRISNEKSACRKSSIASDWVLGSRDRDVAAGDCQFGWLQGVRNLLRQNSFWLQRPDLNQRTWAEPVLTRQGVPFVHSERR
jgi:hypothetical protein